MAIPNGEEARRILAARDLPKGIVIHSEGVAVVAREAARLVSDAGIPVDERLVESAAILHDIDKPMTSRGKADGPDGQHGEVGARMLERMGFAELAPAVASHPVASVLDESRYPRGWVAVLVFLADKHVAQEFLTIDERLDDMQRRYPRFSTQIDEARPRVHALEAELAEIAELEVGDLVERLRTAWATQHLSASNWREARGPSNR